MYASPLKDMKLTPITPRPPSLWLSLPLPTALALAAVTCFLKIVGLCRWPWVWVVCPLWIYAALWAVVFIGGLGVVLYKLHRKNKRQGTPAPSTWLN